MAKNSRIKWPILDEVLDGCRLLPEGYQSIVFFVFYFIFQFFIPLISWVGIIGFIINFCLIIELVALMVIVQKFLIYRRISKIDEAIEIRILWLETRKESDRKNRYIVRGVLAIFIIVGIHYFFYIDMEIRNAILVYLVGVFLLLKGLFYVPVISMEYSEDSYQLILSNDYNHEKTSIDLGDFYTIEIHNSALFFFNRKGELKYNVPLEISNKKNLMLLNNDDVLDYQEMTRLQKFLNGVLLNVDVTLKR